MCNKVQSFAVSTRTTFCRAQSAIRSNKGFSLAEVLTTVSVFSVLAMIGVPNYLAVQPGLRLNGASRQVLSKLMWARSQAVEENTTYAVIFPTSHTMKIFKDANANGIADLTEWTESTDIQIYYPDVSLSASGSTPTFNGRGTANGNTIITVSNGSGSRTITVSLTGNVKID